MLTAYTSLQNAQKVKEYLQKKDLFHPHFLPLKEMGFIYFPIIKKAKIPNAEVINTKFLLPQREKKETIEDILKDKLSKKQFSLLPQSQEIVGNIMILEIPEELKDKEKDIAEAYLALNKNITTIVKKEKMHSGEYRTRKVKILCGKKTKETTHLENGVRIKLHLEKVYFSARSGGERLRISRQVKKGENVLVMFSGAAPFPLVIARGSEAKHIYGVELNPLGHKYAIDNVNLNNLQEKVTVHLGDARKVVPKFRQQFNRIVMPLPKTGEEFLGVALPKVKKGGMIHLYQFLEESNINKHARVIASMCKRLKYPVRIVRKVKCGQFSPGTFRVCFDMKKI
ncbi:hypothetical protein COV20_02385 [Candidatus Woesearchaeota archaeon CG10_big_fil_rev_8_21_14_0_10_45_16]|nr:MAG: hypothetical protein COV20_02385 [Candidatus Woesearchaeota archaeon CG10_big_fil_rev_8_21_14_0_10_45_16]